MTARRRAVALFLLGPLTGAGLVLGATPAHASGSITEPGAGTPYASHALVRIRAQINASEATQLRLKGPTAGSPDQVVDSFSGSVTPTSRTLAFDFDTERPIAVNGVWTVRLTGGATDSRTFTLRIPPRAPASVTARTEGTRAVVVSWRKGEEPDLTGWILYADGGVAQDKISPSACSGTSCSTTVTYAEEGSGQHTYSLVALRRVSPDRAETITSPRSQEVTANLAPPPPPPPPPSEEPPSGGSGGGEPPAPGDSGTGGEPGASPPPDSTGGSGGGSTGGGSTGGGSTGGGSPGGGISSGGAPGSGSSNGGSAAGIGTSSSPALAIDQRRAFALSFKAFAPKLGIPKLPPLPATQLPNAAPLPDGTFEGTLGYKDVVRREKVSTPVAAVRRVGDAVGAALDGDQFLRSLAAALVLLLAAAHLRRWLGSSRPE